MITSLSLPSRKVGLTHEPFIRHWVRQWAMASPEIKALQAEIFTVEERVVVADR